MQNKNVSKVKPAFDGFTHMIHGGDYNPDQWLDMPEILKEDDRLMRLAGVNSASVGIFAWEAIEPSEGVYTFEWLDETLDRLHKNGIQVILATPSGARPAWMDKNHPEVLRVEENRVKRLHGFRHNHCMTSPYFRKKVTEMNTLLAKRYGNHPAVKMWHISNEYGGECHCELCEEAFRAWLRKKYDNDISKLNKQWWTAFWSHTFLSFDEIESPAPQGEQHLHGLKLDWMRFTTDQFCDFMDVETAPLKEICPELPIVTNMMGTNPGIDLWKLTKHMDRAAWDSYPRWGNDEQTTWDMASDVSFVHDINRSFIKDTPFLLMESTPSLVNHAPYNKLKRPGMHKLSSLQAVAHGSDSVQYFQWRKSRGSAEKFHGAVVDHVGHENTRVFRDVAEVGETLKKLDGVVGTIVHPEVALIYDWENDWAIKELQGLSKTERCYEATCKDFYRPLWKHGISCDVISMDCDFSPYKMLIAPMLYMLRPTVADRLKAFVKGGGTLVLSYVTGYVNENDLCFLGGFPGDGLMEVAGVWAEEVDTLFPSDRNKVIFGENSDGSSGTYEVYGICERIHALEGCEVLGTYGSDFYQSEPAVTKHPYGNGVCYYVAARTRSDLMEELYKAIVRQNGIEMTLGGNFPEGVTAAQRYGDGEVYTFVMNFKDEVQTVSLPDGLFTDMETGEPVSELLELGRYGVRILKSTL